MIWATGPKGSVTYVGPEWTVFTGQVSEDALGEGWLDMLHIEDRAPVRSTLADACSASAPFTVQFRLLRFDGTYARVVSGASPSMSPMDGRFLGYLGAIVEVAEMVGNIQGRNGLGRFEIPPPAASTLPLTSLDVIADHVLMARAVAHEAAETELYACLDLAIAMIHARTNRSKELH